VDSVTGARFNLVECSCGMAFVNPMPREESIPDLYPSDYLAGKERNRAKYRRMLELLPFPRTGQRLLDIGCGRGDFIREAAGAGWRAEGVDLIRWDLVSDCPVHVGDFRSMPFPDASYDAITAWAIMEHVRTPALFFSKIGRLLKPGGVFVFVVPNIDAPGMKRSCAEDIPRHLWLYTPSAVRRYLTASGMKTRRILHDGRIYRAYPFGLVRRGFHFLSGGSSDCAKTQNKATALLRHRQIDGNARDWIKEVLSSLPPSDILIDSLDIAIAIVLSGFSRLIRSYGVITVIAQK
jgi:SAM-dependent methyltransferase